MTETADFTINPTMQKSDAMFVIAENVQVVTERAEIIIEREVTAETIIKSAIGRLKGKNISVLEAIERCNEQIGFMGC